MLDAEKCLRCKGENIELGVVQGGIANLTFRSDKKLEKLLGLGFNASLDVKANVCMNCGHIELSADLKHLKKG